MIRPHWLLLSSYAKLGWAQRHLDALQANITAFRSDPSNQAPLRAEFQPKSGYHALKVKRVPSYTSASKEIALAAGDVLVNARAALDHAVWAIVAYHVAPGRPDQPNDVCFPICDSLETVETRYGRAVVDQLPRPCLYVVNEAQPYNAYPSIFPGRPWGRWEYAHPLSLLRDLVNDDKHRLVTPVFCAPSTWKTLNMPPHPDDMKMILAPIKGREREAMGEARLSAQRITETTRKELKPGLVIANMRLAPNANAKMNDAGYVTPDVALPSKENLTAALQRIVSFVEFILGELASVLPSKP